MAKNQSKEDQAAADAAAPANAAEKLVTVTPVKRPVCENGETVLPGQPLKVTAARAKALGKLVIAHEPAKEDEAEG